MDQTDHQFACDLSLDTLVANALSELERLGYSRRFSGSSPTVLEEGQGTARVAALPVALGRGHRCMFSTEVPPSSAGILC